MTENDQLDPLRIGTEPLEKVDLPPKRKPGGPVGNMHGIKTGAYLLRRASGPRLHIRQRRVVTEVAARLTDDLGGAENLSEAQRVIIAIVSRQCGRLDKMHRAYDQLMRKHKQL